MASPYDPIYSNTMTNLGSTRDQSLARLTLQEGQAKRAYGFDDPSNPYSRSKLLEQSYFENRAGIGTSMASRGQLYSGALTNAQTANTGQYNQDVGLLRDEYNTLLSGYGQDRLDVQAEYQRGGRTAGSQALQDALDNPPQDPGETTPTTAGPGKYKTVVKGGKVYHFYYNADGSVKTRRYVRPARSSSYGRTRSRGF